METWMLFGVMNRLVVLPNWLDICLEHRWLKKVTCSESNLVKASPPPLQSEFITLMFVIVLIFLTTNTHNCNINSWKSSHTCKMGSLKDASAGLWSSRRLLYSLQYSPFFVSQAKPAFMYLVLQLHVEMVLSDAYEAYVCLDKKIVSHV